tara:strand:+ start:732 stop:2432 length:1701 start_codon:yes stop_codon:yes gene_type:complete
MEYLVNKVFSYNSGHNSSVCYLENGKLVWMLEEERLSHQKYDSKPFLSIAECGKHLDSVNKVPVILGTSLHHEDDMQMSESSMNTSNELFRKSLMRESISYTDHSDEHHLHHAALGFYNSGFEEAVCVIVDGAGAWIHECAHEVETIYKASYPASFKKLHQKAVPWYTKRDSHNLTDPTIGIGFVYSGVSDYLGFGNLGCGTLMGLAPYGEDDPNIKPFVVDGKIDETLWTREPCGAKLIPYDYIKYIPVFKSLKDPRTKFQNLCNLAWRCQKDFETYMIALIKNAIEISGCNNVVLSGGCALNCVGNYKYLKDIDCNLFVEPISHDAGVSIGMAMYEWRNHVGSMEINPLKDLYLGPSRNHNVPLDAQPTTTKEVIDIIQDGKAVAIFQGRSEQGPRALGNRSLLFDPTIPDAKEIVNKLKGREPFRPFAGTILLEHVHEWFDMQGMKDSPYMMYAVEVLDGKKDIIPSLVHGNTCRIQTLTREQNESYYDLIDEFYRRTGVPILLNTSFNLSGDTIAETIDDAIITLERSEIEYLYLPECAKLLHVATNTNANTKGTIDYRRYR